jgi:GNAT superfamily N-acetyltransferase
MKYYRHYKNKPYRYIGVARHSETLGEVVVYECLYENPSGQLWVRPKEMFHENVQVGGQTIARFAKLPLKIESTTEITEAHLEVIKPIAESTMGSFDLDWVRSRLAMHRCFYLAIASIEGKAVGFKMGYAYDRSTFYSWLGGVLPEHQRLGIASDLIEDQHSWCVKQNYLRVQTKSRNQYRGMFILNLRNGFDVIGTEKSSDGATGTILEKKLSTLPLTLRAIDRER